MQTYTYTATVFDVFADQTIDTRNPPAFTTWHAAASGPGIHVGWDTTDTPPAREARITITITVGGTMKRPPAIREMIGVWDKQGPYPLRSTHEVAQLVAWVKTLEQRNAAAATHIDRARIAIGATAAGYDATLAVDTELCAALDVLAGDA